MARKHRKNVGLIGLGIIGSRAAAGLRAGGFHVFVWNRSPKAAPNFLGSPAEVAEICDVIQLFVADAQAVLEIIDAFGEALTERHIIINCSTIGPEATVEAAKMAQARGAAFLDAPFTGSKLAAEKAQLVYYVGGDESVYLRAKPVLEATSRAIVRCGKIGDAATLKIATNLLSAVTTQTLAEALAIVGRCGISPEMFATAIEHNACKSGVIELKLPKMVAGDYEPHFSLKHMFKDVQLGIHLANSLDLEVPVTTVTAGVMYGALNNGWAEFDYASVYKIYGDAAPAPGVMALPAPEEAKPVPTLASSATVVEAQIIEEKSAPSAKPQPDAVFSDTVKIELPKNEPVMSDTAKIELPKDEPVMSDTVKIELPKDEPVMSDTVKIELPKDEPVLSDTVKIELPKGEPVLSDTVKIELPKGEPVLSDTVKIELPKDEPAMSDTVKIELPKDELKPEKKEATERRLEGWETRKVTDVTPESAALPEEKKPEDKKAEDNGAGEDEGPAFRPIRFMRRFFSATGK